MSGTLLPHHQSLLGHSAITPEVASARGYRSVEKKTELKALGFADGQCRVPALLIPIWGVTGEVALHQIRPDTPRAGRDGRLIRYETPRRACMTLDVHPSIRQHLGNPNRPLFVTEGCRKADSAISHNLCCVALLGVWNWRGSNRDGGSVSLPDWESIALKEREVFIVFDRDVMLKTGVYQALVRLKAFLESRGARGRAVYLDPNTDGSKVGLDNFFTAGHTVSELLAHATQTLRPGPEPEGDSACPYRETPHGLVWRKQTRDGVVETPLCNFTARIVADRRDDDGAEATRSFEIVARQGDRVATVHVAAERFASMSWVADALGARAVIAPGPALRDHARAAIQLLSRDVIDRHVYAHLGWRKIGDRGVYLHAGGGIDANGAVANITVAAPAGLENFVLPVPPEGRALQEAVHASLRVLQVAPGRVTFPAYAALWRAVLGRADLSLFLFGKTGGGKSSLAALLQHHFGAAMDRLNLPANFSSTGNSLEMLAFGAKDTLLVIDEFKPTGSPADVQRYHTQADRIFRATGNHSARQRLRSNGSLRPPKPPRALPLGTGEERPRGESLAARRLDIEIRRDEDLRWDRVGACQTDAAAGVYASAMAGFVRWLAARYDDVQQRLAQDLSTLRQEAFHGGHRRIAENVAQLALGLREFLFFAAAVGAITGDEGTCLMQDFWAAMDEVTAAHEAYTITADLARRFITLIGAALSGGFAHIATRQGNPPEEPQAWGWRFKVVGTGSYEREEWQPQGVRIGWLDEGTLLLEPELSFGVGQSLALKQQDALPTSVQTIGQRLREAGWLRDRDDKRQRLTVRRVCEGRVHAVWALPENIFSLDPLSSSYDRPNRPKGQNAEENQKMDGQMDGHRPKENQGNSTGYDTNGRFGRSPTGEESLPGETQNEGSFFGRITNCEPSSGPSKTVQNRPDGADLTNSPPEPDSDPIELEERRTIQEEGRGWETEL